MGFPRTGRKPVMQDASESRVNKARGDFQLSSSPPVNTSTLRGNDEKLLCLQPQQKREVTFKGEPVWRVRFCWKDGRQ